MKKRSSALSKIFTAVIYILLYSPIAVMILFSFNDSKSMTNFTGFSLRWYKELFSTGTAFNALKYSLIIAVLSALAATVIGTLAAYGVHYMRNKWLKKVVTTVNDIPMMNPDIVTGISLLLLFAAIQAILGLNSSILGFWTLLIAHITFNVPYVILNVLPKLRQMDRSLTEAALDLGCTPTQAFFKVELPSIMPGIVSGAIMAFTLSIDDFVISNFTIGNSFQTLPILIYSMTKREVTPDMNAICSIVFVVIFILLLITNLSNSESNGGKPGIGVKIRSFRARHKRGFAVIAVSIAAAIVLGTVSFFAIFTPEETLTLNVYNWGEYISDGSEDSFDTIAGFEEYYEKTYGKKVKVNYTTYASNEDMYNKLSSGAAEYDVIIPSDYMIAKLAAEDLLEPLDFSLIPNYETNILDGFKGLYYDPDEIYSVPYTYGVIGVIYNTASVDAADVESEGWEVMRNEKYEGKILQYNNPRDAFGTAMYALDIDVNTTDKALWDKSIDWLIAQKPVVQSYVMDEIYNKMESGEAWISSYYAGDYLFMYSENEDLGFYQPEATNYFIDAMCIPKGAKNYELANIFINYMLSEEPAVANAEMICYASPNQVVIENEGYIEYMTDIHEDAMEILYPEGLDFKAQYDKYAYRNLDTEMNSYMNTLWSKLKVTASEDEGPEITNYIAAGCVATGLILAVYFAVRRRKRKRYYK